MAKSLQARIDVLRKALEAQQPAEVPIGATIILAETREQALQLQSLPPVALPALPDNARIILSARVDGADAYLATHPAGSAPVAPGPSQAPPAIA